MEMNQYLSAMNEDDVGIVEFWQVSDQTMQYPLVLSDLNTGQSRAISSYFSAGYGYHSHPGLKPECPLWKGIFIWEGNNGSQTKAYFSWFNGSTSGPEIFHLQRLIIPKLYWRDVMGRWNGECQVPFTWWHGWQSSCVPISALLLSVPFLPPPVISLPTYPSLLLPTTSFLLSPSPQVGTLSMLVQASSLWWMLVMHLWQCDVMVCDHMFEFEISDGIRVGRVNEWCSLMWDYVAVNWMACRVSRLGTCCCVSHWVPFLAEHHTSDMAWHAKAHSFSVSMFWHSCPVPSPPFYLSPT